MPEDTGPICESCIWNFDHEGLVRTGPCDPHSWAGAVQQELLREGTDPDISTQPGPFPPFLPCAVVTMVKDEADILRANFRWLYHVGARRFIVMDNMSSDGTLNEIQRFAIDHPLAQVIVLHDPVLAHYQAEKVTALAQLARSIWPDIAWVLPVDADEFCVARHGLVALAYVPLDIEALTVPKTVHFLPTGHAGEEAADPLPRMKVRSGLFVVPPKVIVRAHRNIGVTQGNHRARKADGTALRYTGAFQYGLFYREFQTRSFAQFARKVRNGAAAIEAARAAGRDVGGQHWMAWHRILQEQGEPGLRQAFYAQCFRSKGPGYVIDSFMGAPA